MNTLPDENIYGHTKKLRYILNQIRIHKVSKDSKINLLDFGCGNGTAVSKYLIDSETNYYGVDIHAPSLRFASAEYSSSQAKFFSEIPDGIVFDVIVYADILEHLDDPESILSDHYKRLADNGIMIGAVPNGYGPFEIEKKLDRYLLLDRFINMLSKIKYYLKSKIHKGEYDESIVTQIDNLPYNIDSGHVQFFTKKRLYEVFMSSNLKVVDFKNGVFLGAPIISSRILTNKYIINLNAKIADYLPYYLASTWYFTINKAS